MDSPEISRAALERLLQPLTGDRVEVVVTYRRYDELNRLEELLRRNNISF